LTQFGLQVSVKRKTQFFPMRLISDQPIQPVMHPAITSSSQAIRLAGICDGFKLPRYCEKVLQPGIVFLCKQKEIYCLNLGIRPLNNIAIAQG
jgi:hypothetical protein